MVETFLVDTLLFPSPLGAVRSKGPVVQYTQDLTGAGTQYKPLEQMQAASLAARSVSPQPAEME